MTRWYDAVGQGFTRPKGVVSAEEFFAVEVIVLAGLACAWLTLSAAILEVMTWVGGAS
jgi:hypothetical protein